MQEAAGGQAAMMPECLQEGNQQRAAGLTTLFGAAAQQTRGRHDGGIREHSSWNRVDGLSTDEAADRWRRMSADVCVISP